MPNYIYSTEVLNSKLLIYTFFQEKIFSLLDLKDTDCIIILKDIGKFMMSANKNIHDLIYKLNLIIEEKTEFLKKQHEENTKTLEGNITNLHQLNNLVESLEEKVRERDFIINTLEEEKNFLNQKINKLENENRVMTEKIIKKAKDLTQINENFKEEEDQYNSKSKSVVLNRSNINTGEMTLNKSRSGKNIIVGPVGARVLTKKMLLEIIEEIYNSKANFDKKCSENKMPKETMEQHMYTFLNHKYGLKNLIIEWATSIINGIRMFSQEDSDVCLFGKILRNEIEEESRLVIKKLKTTVLDLLTYFLKAKTPLKANSDILDLTNQRQNSFVLEDEWKGIIYYLFENSEAKSLENRIIEFIKKKYYENKMDVSKKLTREEIQNLSKIKEEYKILYSDFVKVYINYNKLFRLF